jgi:hypothetical protein
LDKNTSWEEYSQIIHARALGKSDLKLDLTVKSGKELRKKISTCLNTAHDSRILREDFSSISKLLKVDEDKQRYLIMGGLEKGGVKNTDRTKEIPHFSRHDGFWFDFSIMVDQTLKPAEVIGFNFELRFPESLIEAKQAPQFIRFDFNPPGHSNDIRLHMHPGTEDFMIPSPPMTPLEILHRDAVLERLQSQDLIKPTAQGWIITNMAAILLAKKLDAFSRSLARKAPRFIIYEGIGKFQTRSDHLGNRGYAIGFEGLVTFVHTSAPQNRFIEEVIREEVKMFPRKALRELIANALVHQDFLATGTSPMIEMYSDRIEISNPGTPPIDVDRFIDEYRSRNEKLADLMRRFGICEEKGSGIDKVVEAAEVYQLPAPDFRVGETRTTAILFAHQDFADMSKSDRIRACYQHCCLLYVTNRRMSNQTLRDRFRLIESKTATVSLVIKATKDAGLINPDESESTSTRYASYLPFWA